MKLLFLSNQYPPDTAGGIGSYVQSAARALAGAGHEVHVVTRSLEEHDFEDDGVLVHLRPSVSGRGLGLLNMPMAASRLTNGRSALRNYKDLGIDFDVVEAPDWGAEALLISRKVPSVVHLHTGVLLNSLHGGRKVDRDVLLANRLERQAAIRASAITTPSELMTDELDRHGWLRGCVRPKVIRYPVDLDTLASVGPVDETDPVVLFAGRLEVRKAPEVLIEAASQLRNEVSDLEVLLVGRSSPHASGGSYEHHLRSLAERLGVRCQFQPHVHRDAMKNLYSKVRVVAIPSRFDNFPMTALEAMASGRPVVVTDRTGTSELLTGPLRDLVVPADDPSSLAGAMRPLLADARYASRVGSQCRQRVEAECDPQMIGETRTALYQALTSKDSR